MNFTNVSATPSRASIPAWYWAASALISFVSILGNGLVIYILGTRPRLRTSVNWFVLSLCTADFFTGLFMPPLSFICVFGGVKCNRMLHFLFYNALLSISVASIFAMTLDRYLAIVTPLKYHSLMTSHCTCALITSAWLVPTLLSFLPLTWVYLDLPNKTAADARKFHTAAMLVFFEFVPPVVMILMYARILLTARRHARQTANQIAQVNFNHRTSSRYRSDRSAKVIGAVILLFVGCWFLDIYKSICDQFEVCHVSRDATMVSVLLLYLNAAVNPIAYALLKTDVKRELRKMFCCAKISSLRTSRQRTNNGTTNEEGSMNSTAAW